MWMLNVIMKSPEVALWLTDGNWESWIIPEECHLQKVPTISNGQNAGRIQFTRLSGGIGGVWKVYGLLKRQIGQPWFILVTLPWAQVSIVYVQSSKCQWIKQVMSCTPHHLRVLGGTVHIQKVFKLKSSSKISSCINKQSHTEWKHQLNNQM